LLRVAGGAEAFRQLEEGFLLLSLGFDSLLDEFYQHAIVGGWPTFTFSVKVGTTRSAVRAAPIDQRSKDEDQIRGAGGMGPHLCQNRKGGPATEKEVQRVAAIAQQMLGFVRESSSPFPLNVAATVDDVLLLYMRPLSEKHIQIDKIYDPAVAGPPLRFL
jgi:hypothetical protein